MAIRIGIVGGSGLYEMDALRDRREVAVETPWGVPSAPYTVGRLAGRDVAFLARHGRGHRINPSQLNFRANIYGFKQLGVEYLLSFSAVGSLRARLEPLHFVVPDQFFDRTKGRPSTFFDDGITAHITFSHPVCGVLSDIAARACEQAGVTVHRGGTYCCMEGPAFSTLAESNLYRSWGLDVIGMTNLQEAKLAREAEICFATIAMATDYDCWNEAAGDVDIEEVIAVLQRNADVAKRIVRGTLEGLSAERACPCATALAMAIVTDRALIPDEARKRLGPLVDKYL